MFSKIVCSCILLYNSLLYVEIGKQFIDGLNRLVVIEK